MNCYEILEVSPNASQEVIRAAYKSLMQRYHPDRNPGDREAAEHASRVNLAYEVLSDPARRAAHDIELGRLLQAKPNDALDRGRAVLERHAAAARDGQSHWFLWLMMAAVFLYGWYALSTSGKKRQATALETRNAGRSPEQAKDEAARTIPVLVEKLTVNLRAQDKSSSNSGESPEGAARVLFIPVLGIKVGSFDPDKSIAFIERNKETIVLKLAENLASARHEELGKSDGEAYLKNLILDSICESAGSNRREDYPASATEAPGRYGPIDVLLPQSFLVR
ncbi:MAG: J domain-containing protein [Proteobacteria bacterium]|nr:J domain-containing protein [Pseudomonadota bacterium]